MKKVYNQPSLVITHIAACNICVTSVRGNLPINMGGPQTDYSGAV